MYAVTTSKQKPVRIKPELILISLRYPATVACFSHIIKREGQGKEMTLPSTHT